MGFAVAPVAFAAANAVIGPISVKGQALLQVTGNIVGVVTLYRKPYGAADFEPTGMTLVLVGGPDCVIVTDPTGQPWKAVLTTATSGEGVAYFQSA